MVSATVSGACAPLFFPPVWFVFSSLRMFLCVEVRNTWKDAESRFISKTGSGQEL